MIILPRTYATVPKSNFVAICHYLYLKDMENDEIDLIKGNPFEENIQHNS